ncbi:MAG: capsid protein [Clostridium sp.]|uniref:capsid protein n=1 Tax=Clostridium sp. TaxID=1506 RepID=UPI0039E8751E
MGWLKNMATKVMKLLNIRPAPDKTINIIEPLSFQGNVLKNRIWYRGDPSELDQFFKQSARDLVSQSRFWSAVPSNKLNIRKIHSGIPAMIVERLGDIIVADIEGIDVGSDELNTLFEEISANNNFNKVIGEAIVETLVTGDGAFKITVDTDITIYPIIDYYGGERVDYTVKRGRIQEIIFYTSYAKENRNYTLQETFGKGYIKYLLYDDSGKEVPINTVEETAELKDTTFDGNFIMAVPMMFFKSQKFDGRGKSIFDSKSDSFDALDETISQWVDAIRAGRVQKYIPKELLPINPSTGEVLEPNPFDNQFISRKTVLSENAIDKMDVVQAEINYSAFVETYASNLDMCLQGIISPATLGIDLKKTDNAEAQREKEKTTLYTRGKIIDVLTEVIPNVVSIALQVNDLLHSKAPGEYEATINFGEYASPSFDTVVDTVGKAKLNGIMSIEQCVEELYGDTWTDEDKALEVQRLKEEQGLTTVDPPAVNGADPPPEDIVPPAGE